MMNYSDYEVRELAERAQARIEMDKKYTRETEEAYESKKYFRIHQIIIDVVKEAYGKVIQEIIDMIKNLLPMD